MKTFHVYIKGGDLKDSSPVFVEDGISAKAMIFSVLWLIYYSLWAEILVFFILQIFISLIDSYVGKQYYLALEIILHISIGVFATQLRIWKLKRTNYKFRDIIIALNLEKAKLKFYKKYLRAKDTDEQQEI